MSAFKVGDKVMDREDFFGSETVVYVDDEMVVTVHDIDHHTYAYGAGEAVAWTFWPVSVLRKVKP